MKGIKSKLFAAAAGVLLLVTAAGSVSAEPYDAYTYNSYGEAVSTPYMYTVEKVLYGTDVSDIPLIEPEDLCVDEQGRLYILDSGNNRIITLDASGSLLSIRDTFLLDGQPNTLTKPQGIYVRNGILYVADTGNSRVLCIAEDGTISRVIEKPESVYFDESMEFIPTKVTADSSGNVYVLATGLYNGLAVFGPAGDFQGFYGSEMVNTTAQALADFFWKQLMTAEQKEAMANYVPPEICNIFITDNNFMYTVTPAAMIPLTTEKEEMDSIRRLNPKGEDVLESKMPDAARQAMELQARQLDFVDVCADKNGFVSLVDRTMGRVYHFDNNMNLLCAFGGYGEYAGTFRMARAIDTWDGRLFVLDKQKGSITVFAPTSTGEAIHTAIQLQNEGHYEEALEPWQTVLAEDPNSELACNGIGNALLGRRDYKQAMDYFARGRDSVKYNQAFREYRLQLLRGIFPFAAAALVLILVAAFVYRRVKKPAAAALEVAAKKDLKRGAYPLYIMRHPTNGFDALRYRKQISVGVSLILFAALVLMDVLSLEFAGLQFRVVDKNAIDLIGTIFSRLAVLLLFVVANWSFCVVMDGKARFVDIWVITLYSLLPYILCGYIRIVLENVLTREEGAFLTLLTAVGVLWSLVLLVTAFMSFHEYSLSRTIASLLLTVIGMLIILFLLFLLYSLFQKVAETFTTIFNEILFRIRLDS